MKSNVSRVKVGLNLTTNWYGLISQHIAECQLDLGEMNTNNDAGRQRAIFQSSHMQLLCDLSPRLSKTHLHQLVNQSGFNITITEVLIQAFMMIVLGKRFSSSRLSLCV